jgi:uncharacterized LabA/DUF88 family protein
MTAYPRVAVFVDRANMYYRGRAAFGIHRDADARIGICCPIKLAHELARRNGRESGGYELVLIEVHTGLHVERMNIESRRAALSLFSQWEKKALAEQERLRIVKRPLDYKKDRRGREKGVDVALAIGAFKCVALKECDVAIIVSHDTDMQPAVEAIALTFGVAAVETASWRSSSFSQKIRTEVEVVNHLLWDDAFERVTDDVSQTSA